MADKSSREQVAELLKQDKSVKEIAESLDMSAANVYAHKRKIEAESGQAPRKRGRPPKVKAEGDEAPKTEKSESDSEAKSEAPKASRPAPGKPKSGNKPVAKVSTNGHGSDNPFLHTLEGLDQDLSEARRRVAQLEKMREALVS